MNEHDLFRIEMMERMGVDRPSTVPTLVAEIRRLRADSERLLWVVRQVFDLVEAASLAAYLREGVPEREAAEQRRDEILDGARSALRRVGDVT